MNKIKLNILKESDILNFVEVGKEYSLFVGIGKKQYYFSNLKKAKKFLSAYSKALQTLIDEFSLYHSSAYELFVESLNYLHISDIKGINKQFKNAVDSFLRLNSSQSKGTGFYLHASNYVNSILEIVRFYKNFYKKRRFNYLIKKSRYLLRQCENSINLIENVIVDYREDLTEINTKDVPVITFGFNNQLKIVS